MAVSPPWASDPDYPGAAPRRNNPTPVTMTQGQDFESMSEFGGPAMWQAETNPWNMIRADTEWGFNWSDWAKFATSIGLDPNSFFAFQGYMAGKGGPGGRGGGGGMSRGQQIGNLRATIINMAGEWGIPLTDVQINQLAASGVDNKWGQEQLADEIIKFLDFGNLNEGTVKASVEQMKALGRAYLTNLSDASARDYAKRVASGELTLDGLRTVFTEHARQRFGWAAGAIDSGVTVADMLAPLRDQIANELELAPEEVDLMDDNWLKMVEVRDPKDGTLRAATLSEVQRAARQDARWAKTQNAQEMASQAGQMLAGIFTGAR